MPFKPNTTKEETTSLHYESVYRQASMRDKEREIWARVQRKHQRKYLFKFINSKMKFQHSFLFWLIFKNLFKWKICSWAFQKYLNKHIRITPPKYNQNSVDNWVVPVDANLTRGFNFGGAVIYGQEHEMEMPVWNDSMEKEFKRRIK